MKYFYTYIIGLACYSFFMFIYERHTEEVLRNIQCRENKTVMFYSLANRRKRIKRKIIKFFCIALEIGCVSASICCICYVCYKYGTWNIIELIIEKIVSIIKIIFTFLAGICTPYCTKLATKTLKKNNE